MAPVGTRKIIWRGGEHEFCLAAFGDIVSLEENCRNTGIRSIYQRLATDSWGVNDVREPIRIGLMGRGMPPDKAMALVKAHVDGNPNGLAPSVVLAMAIIEAVIVGVPDDEVGKKDAAEAETGQASITKTAASAAPLPSESAPA